MKRPFGSVRCPQLTLKSLRSVIILLCIVVFSWTDVIAAPDDPVQSEQTDDRSILQRHSPESRSEYDSWLAPPPNEQLYNEGLDDQKGIGRIFVPAITNSANEPNYAVFDQNDELIGERRMGTSFFLAPGQYTVLLGTGTIDQRITRNVNVHRGQTIILEPDWCALTIEVIDELRNYVKQDMQIYRIETLESFGVIPSINPELGEQLQTLLLAPGLYKIVERGRDINTLVNFATVLLEPKTYTPYTIVINSQTTDFTGSGILTSASQLRQRRHLRLFGAVHGSIMLNSTNDVNVEETRTNFSILTQLENRILFDRLPHYYLSSNWMEVEALRPQEGIFQISQDRVQLKNTYVYYLLGWLGGYVRLELTTHLFPKISRFDERRDIILQNLSGDDQIKHQVANVRLEPSLFPLGLKEGIGVNITPLRTFQARLSFRAGFGFRQNYNNNVYQQSTEADTVYKRIPDNFLRGLEMSVISNLSLLRNLAVTTELDVLFPISGDEKKPVVDFENVASIALTRNISFEYIFRLSRVASLDWTVQKQFISVRVSYFIF